MFTNTDRKSARRKSINDRQLLIAVIDENFEEVNRLLDENVDVNFKDRDECTALHVAAANGDLNVVKLLVERGAALNVKNMDGETPLQIAKRLNKSEIVNIFESLNNDTSRSSLSQNQQEFSQNKILENKHYVWIDPVHEKIYQLKVLILFLYKGVACKYSFRLGTETKEARKFDDLVFEYTENGRIIYRILQAKHRIDSSKKITVESLLAEEDGDYSLTKYFLFYQASKKDNLFKNGTIKDVTICTNIDFDYENLQGNQIEVEKIPKSDDILDVQSEGKEQTRYKFTKKLIPKLRARLQTCKLPRKYKILDGEIDDFLQHLVFAVNQPNVEEFGNIVKNEISKEFDFITTENAYNKFVFQILNWIKSRDKSAFLPCKTGKKLFEEMKKRMPIWYNVQDPIKSFTGRSKHLDDIHKLLQTEEESIVCVSGLGGVGKSELAKKYIMEYSQSYDDRVVWINAESYQTLVESFRELACEKLGIKTENADGKEKTTSTLIAETYQYFSGRKSLFVFDNYEMYKSQNKVDTGIDRFLPRLPKDCQQPYILITSRNKKWPKNVKVQILEAFTEKEATLFITAALHLENEEQKMFATELGKKLQLLPLALQQAVAYIKVQDDEQINVGSRFQISDYFTKLVEKSKEISSFEFPSNIDNTYSNTLFTTLNVTIDAIKVNEYGEDALDILCVASYFLPDNIPIDMLSMIKSNEEMLESAFELLKEYSVIDVQYKTVSLHRSVQQMTRLKLEEMNKEKAVLEVILKEIKKETVNVKTLDHLISIWQYCTKHIELVEKYHFASSLIVQELIYGLRLDEAKELITIVIELLTKLPKNNISAMRRLAASKSYKAYVFFSEGKLEEYLRELLEAYKIAKVVCDPCKKDSILIKANIISAFLRLGRNDEALKWCQEVLKEQTAGLGGEHHETLTTRLQLATILMVGKQYDEALSTAKFAYDIYKKNFGEDHLYTMNAKSTVASIYTKLGKYDEAMQIFQVIYDIKKKRLGANNPTTLGARLNIAMTLGEQADKYRDAVKMYEEILIAEVKLRGENHPEIIKIQSTMADILNRHGEHNRTLTVLRDVVQKQRANIESYYTQVFQNELVMAQILYAQGKDDEALPLFEGLLKFDKEMAKNEESVHTYIANILMRQKKFERAAKHASKVAEIKANTLGADHAQTIQAKKTAGNLYFTPGNHEKGLKILTGALSSLEEAVGIEDESYKSFQEHVQNLSLSVPGNQSSNNSTPKNPFAAIDSGDFNCLKKFVQNGTDPNSQDEDGWTLLLTAASADNLEIVKFLMASGAEVTRASRTGYTPLHFAASNNNIAMATALLDVVSHQALRKFINAKITSSGQTALHLASGSGLPEMTRFLLIRGACYDVKNKSQESPLDAARDTVIRGLLEQVDANFQLAKDVSVENHECFEQCTPEDFLMYVNARNVDGYNLVQTAVISNNQTLVYKLQKLHMKVLHSRNPTFDSRLDELLGLATTAFARLRDDQYSKKTALKTVRKLVHTFRSEDKRALDPNILAIEDMLKLLDSHHNTENLMDLACSVIDNHLQVFEASIYSLKLLEAAKSNDLARVREYVNQAAFVNVTDDAGWTPLLLAVNLGSEEMVDFLLEHDAELNCATKAGKSTPLHIAVNKGHTKVVETLLLHEKAGYIINARTEGKSSTALHIAAKNGCLGMVMLLLRYGAAYSPKNKEGQSPMDLTDDDSIKTLLQIIRDLFGDVAKGSKGVLPKMKAMKKVFFLAVINARNDEGYSLAGLAAVKGHEALRRGMLKHYEELTRKPM